jgi:hypothetical protein
MVKTIIFMAAWLEKGKARRVGPAFRERPYPLENPVPVSILVSTNNKQQRKASEN